MEEGEVTLVHRISPSHSDEDDEVIGNKQILDSYRVKRSGGHIDPESVFLTNIKLINSFNIRIFFLLKIKAVL